jgi:hypothetical protein
VTTPLAFKDAREWGELVQRVFSGDAPAEIVPPGIILAADLPEWWVLRKVIPFYASIFAAAGAAGNFSAVQFTVGPPTDQVAVIERLFVLSTVNYSVGLLSPPVATTSSTRATSRDLRAASLVTFAGAATALGAAPTGLNAQFPPTPAQGLEIPIRPFIVGTLASGVQTALVVASSTAVTAITAYAWGYQRRLRPEERQVD